jgi:hypothetical protein
MNRLVCVAVMVALLAGNPAAWADAWHGQGNPGHGNPGQWHGNPGGHGGSSWHGNSTWHGNGGWHNAGWHGNGGWHGASNYYYGYRPYYAHAYYPYRPYYYPYRPYYYPYYRPVGYPYPYYGGYGYYPYYHHNNNNNSDWPAYLAGGLIVGALAANAYNNSQARTYSYPQAAPATPIGSVQGRHLLRDLNGKCYERQTDANGNEMRTELPPSECNW